MDKAKFTRELTEVAHNMPTPSREEKEAIEGLLTDAFNSMTVNKTLLYAFRLGMAFFKLKEETRWKPK